MTKIFLDAAIIRLRNAGFNVVQGSTTNALYASKGGRAYSFIKPGGLFDAAPIDAAIAAETESENYIPGL